MAADNTHTEKEDRMNMALFTAVKEGDLVKTRSILEDETGDAKLVTLHSVDPDGNASLHIASEEGHIDLVTYLIDLGADLEKRNRSGDSPLHYASRSGHQDVAQYLISKGADINIGDNNGYTPIYLASEKGNFGVVECLVNSGADVNKASYNGSTPIYTSASKGHLDVVKYLITKGVEIDRDSGGGYTRLHSALQEGHLALDKFLVDAGADVKRLIYDDSPLHAASENGYLDVVKCLISEGAEIDRDGDDGYTPLHLASLEGHLTVVEFLVDAGADVNTKAKNEWTPMYAASNKGHLDIVKYLITRGAAIDRRGYNGRTPLGVASIYGHLSVVKYLISQRADKDIGDNDGFTPLHDASQEGHYDVVQYLVNEGAEVNKAANDGDLSLHVAARRGHLDIVKYLIDKGADIDRKGYNGKTPLHVSSFLGHLAVVKYLISQRADKDIGDNDGFTPLYDASQEGHHDVVQYLVNEGAEVNKAAKNGDISLHAASLSGHLDIVKYLIDKGADKDIGDNDGFTPLYDASQEGHQDVVQYLVNEGAEVNKAAKNGDLSLHAASRMGHLDIVKYLIDKGADIDSRGYNGKTPLHVSSYFGHLAVVKYLITQQADKDVGDNNGYTSLYDASHEGHYDVVQYLVNEGAEVNKAAHDGDLSLHVAARMGHLDIAKYLINKGADKDMGDNHGFTPLYDASHEGHYDVVQYLVNEGAEVNKARKSRSTPLYAASNKGHLDIVKYLIDKGADIDRKGYNGNTPLHSSSFHGHLAVVKYLISQRADKDIGDNHGFTPLYAASQEGHHDVVQYLVNEGAEVNKAAKSGFTPLYAASNNGHLDIVKYLIDKGADIDRRGYNGKMPLHSSSFHGHFAVVKYLISQRADKDVGDNNGYTSLYDASQEGHYDVVQYLVNEGAEVNKAANDGDLSLHAAARMGHLDVIKYLITKGANIEAHNNDGWTVFHFLADNGHFECLKHFLRNNSSGPLGYSLIALKVGLQILEGVTPLMVAARGGHLDCVRLLLENNEGIEEEDAEGWTALHYAAASGNESLMNDLLDRKAFMRTRLSRRGQSLISIALRCGNVDTARILLDKDASSIQHSDSAGLTPIHLATVSGLTSIIEELISLGAGLNPQSHDGQTPLHVAIRLCHCKKRQIEVTTALKQIQQESEDDLSPAEALIQFLINQGSKIDIKDNKGFTPVQYAREERIRQMVFRSLSEDDVHIFRDLPIARSTESHRSIGCEGGILHLDSCDVTMSIPPITVQAGTCHDVSIALVTDDPPPIREREFLTGCGIDITFPAQWRFSTNRPITLSLPHAATLLESNDVHAGIIWKQTESNSVNRNESFDGSETQCIMKEREINLIIDAGSIIKDKVQLWIPIELHHAHGKRMACTPFLPVDMAHGEDIPLRIYIHEDIPYIVQKIQEEEENFLYRQVHPGRCFALEPESSDLELECNRRKKIISATELFNRQKTLVSMPITTETNARMQMINISISATSTNQPNTSMAFMAIRTGFSTDIHSSLDEIVPGSNTDLSNAEEIQSEDFITKEMNTDQYYHLGLALGMSYQTLDTIEFRSRQHEESGVYTPNQKAAIFMIRYWKCLQHSVSIADDHLREVWKSVSDSRHSIPVLQQGRRAENEPDNILEDVIEGEFPREESRTALAVGLHANEVEIPRARGHWAERLDHKRPNTPSVRSDSSSSYSTLLEEEREVRFSKRYGEYIPRSVRARRRTSSTSKHIPDRVHRVLSIDEHHEDEEKERSKRAIFAWMEAGKRAKPADLRPHEYTSEPTDDEGQMAESVQQISSPSAPQEESPVQNPESRDDLNEDTDVIRLEKHGIEVRIPPNGAYSAKDVTVEPIFDIPPELVLKETEAIISFGLRMSPPDATFDNPVTVTMPHCGIFTKPEAAKVVTYYRKSASESFTAIPSSNGSPRCVVRDRDLDVYMDHFSEIWIVAIITWVFIGKRVICTPYIPVSTPRNGEHVLFVHVRNANIEKEVQPGYMAPITGEQFLVRWRSGGLKITCLESTMKDKAKTLQEREIRHLTEQKVMFKADTRTYDKNKVILQFILEQSTTKELLVPMHLEEITETLLGDTVSISPRPSFSTSAAIHVQDASAAAGKVSTARTREVSDAMLNELVRNVPNHAYNTLSEKLGIQHNQAMSILVKYTNDYEKATRECFAKWKDRSTRSVADLHDVLGEVELGGLIVPHCN